MEYKRATALATFLCSESDTHTKYFLPDSHFVTRKPDRFLQLIVSGIILDLRAPLG